MSFSLIMKRQILREGIKISGRRLTLLKQLLRKADVLKPVQRKPIISPCYPNKSCADGPGRWGFSTQRESDLPLDLSVRTIITSARPDSTYQLLETATIWSISGTGSCILNTAPPLSISFSFFVVHFWNGRHPVRFGGQRTLTYDTFRWSYIPPS